MRTGRELWPYLLVAAGCIAVTLAIYVHAAAMGVQADESALPAPSETALLSLGEIAVALLSTTIAIVSIVLAIRDAGKRGR